jgi:hypothetical protein
MEEIAHIRAGEKKTLAHVYKLLMLDECCTNVGQTPQVLVE